MKLFNDLHNLPMSHIIFPPGFILPPNNFAPVLFCPLEIVEWFSLYTHVPYHFPPGFILPLYHFAPPYHFDPWKSPHDKHYLPMSHIIFPLDSFCPHIILPPYHFIILSYSSNLPCLYSTFHLEYPLVLSRFCPLPLERNCFMICTLYQCPVSFCPLDWTLWVGLLCFNILNKKRKVSFWWCYLSQFSLKVNIWDMKYW